MIIVAGFVGAWVFVGMGVSVGGIGVFVGGIGVSVGGMGVDEGSGVAVTSGVGRGVGAGVI